MASLSVSFCVRVSLLFFVLICLHCWWIKYERMSEWINEWMNAWSTHRYINESMSCVFYWLQAMIHLARTTTALNCSASRPCYYPLPNSNSYEWSDNRFLQRAAKLALQTLYLLQQIHPSVCPSHFGIVSKRGNAEGCGFISGSPLSPVSLRQECLMGDDPAQVKF